MKSRGGRRNGGTCKRCGGPLANGRCLGICLTKALGGALVLCLLSAVASAQGSPPLSLDYDLDSTTYVCPAYCTPLSASSQGDCSIGNPGRLEGRKVTNEPPGAGVTIVSVGGTSAPFLSLSVGDLVLFQLPTFISGTNATVQSLRRVLTKTSSDEITIDSNVTLPAAGIGFVWWKFSAGTAGWFAFPRESDSLTVNVAIPQMNAASIDYKVECRRLLWDVAVLPWLAAGPTNVAAAMTNSHRVAIDRETWDQCRVCFKINTDDGDDTGANAEKVTVVVERGVEP